MFSKYRPSPSAMAHKSARATMSNGNGCLIYASTRAKIASRAALSSLSSTTTCARDNSASLSANDGFSVVAPTKALVGATTENPSFALNDALLSRAHVVVLERLDKAALEAILARVEAYIKHPLPLDMVARADLCAMADGDGRYLLNMVALLINRPIN